MPDVIPHGLRMLRVGGRYVLGGLVNPNADVTIDANVILRQWITLRGIHNYHPRHLIQALLEEAGDAITLAVDSALAGAADTDRILADLRY